MAQPIYKTEKRKAEVGERILITNADYELSDYQNGDVFTVSNSGTTGVELDCGMRLQHHEYVVFVGEHAPAPTLYEMNYDELVALVEDAMKALRTRSYKNTYDQGSFDAEIEAPKPDQQKRDEIVAKAKEDVEDLVRRHFVSKADFIVNAAKRTVVALGKSWVDGRILRRGIAKCAPDDCFNAHIGKAIALRRALRLEVPSEYLNVPQPTEVRVGDVVESANWAGYRLEFTVQRIENDRVYGEHPWIYAHLDQASLHGFLATDPKTIDDTGAGEGE